MVTKEQKQHFLKEAQDKFLRQMAAYSNEGKTVRAREARELIGQYVRFKTHIDEVWKNILLNEYMVDIGMGNYRISTRGVREINEYAGTQT